MVYPRSADKKVESSGIFEARGERPAGIKAVEGTKEVNWEVQEAYRDAVKVPAGVLAHRSQVHSRLNGTVDVIIVDSAETAARRARTKRRKSVRKRREGGGGGR
ncbi:hypothetical protein KM043_006425 [Ampulex compressa]|nr:hypothetical protein KM043_006425 [Ampulex compressa]